MCSLIKKYFTLLGLRNTDRFSACFGLSRLFADETLL